MKGALRSGVQEGPFQGAEKTMNLAQLVGVVGFLKVLDLVEPAGVHPIVARQDHPSENKELGERDGRGDQSTSQRGPCSFRTRRLGPGW